ncbi:MAG: Zn-dependent alcohol dehydrogenase [Deltaproteobacteria bacterium]|nr:Zn-dependent alcohol dehydrogenase [Deltaproteobacteria bacterium]MBI4223490.1 Zn-dependent alcohol dehydrogenase [Deltaproteobacteria bacterium]
MTNGEKRLRTFRQGSGQATDRGPRTMELQTKAAVLYAAGKPFEITDINVVPPGEGEVLVRMAAAGICGSDEAVRTGKRPHAMPVVCGHEGAGFVEALGEGVARLNRGDFVILNWQPACGTCAVCGRGQPNLCTTFPERVTKPEARFFLKDGSPVFSYSHLGCFAQRVTVRQECCVVVDKKIPPEVSCLIGCAVTTGVGAVLNTARVKAGESVAIFGMGGVGLSIVMGGKLAGAESIIAVDTAMAKKKMALELGATDFFQEGAKVRNVDYAFDAVGSPEVVRKCLDAVRPGGTVVCVGLPAMSAEYSLPAWKLVVGEKKIIGSLYGSADPFQFFSRLVDFYLEGKLPLDRLISKTYTLEEINAGFEALRSGRTGRGVIRF